MALADEDDIASRKTLTKQSKRFIISLKGQLSLLEANNEFESNPMVEDKSLQLIQFANINIEFSQSLMVLHL